MVDDTPKIDLLFSHLCVWADRVMHARNPHASDGLWKAHGIKGGFGIEVHLNAKGQEVENVPPRTFVLLGEGGLAGVIGMVSPAGATLMGSWAAQGGYDRLCDHFHVLIEAFGDKATAQ